MDQSEIHRFNRTHRYMQIIPAPRKETAMSYNRETIIKQVQAHALVFDINLDRLVVTGQAALVLHGLLDTTDRITCDLHHSDFAELTRMNPTLPTADTLRGIETRNNTPVVFTSQNGSDQHVCELGGLVVMTLEELKREYDYLSGHSERSAVDREKDDKILGLLTERLRQIERSQPLTRKNVGESLATFSEGIWELPRLTAYVKSTPVGTYVPFHGANGRVWFAMHVMNSSQAFVQIYETERKSADTVNLDNLCFKHVAANMRYETAVY